MRPATTSTSATLAAIVTGVLLLAACGGDSSTGNALAPTDGSGAMVSIERSRYAPEEIDVAAGAEVRFVNLDPFAHTVTAASDSSLEFDSGDLGEGDAFVQRFDEAGVYDYFCEIHPTMRATVVVE